MILFSFNVYIKSFYTHFRELLYITYTIRLMETVRTVAGGDEQFLLSCCCLAESAMMCKRLHQADGSIHLQHWHKSVWMWEHVVLGISLININSVLRLILSSIPAGTTRGGDLSTTTFFLAFGSTCAVNDMLCRLTAGPERHIKIQKAELCTQSAASSGAVCPLCLLSFTMKLCAYAHVWTHWYNYSWTDVDMTSLNSGWTRNRHVLNLAPS